MSGNISSENVLAEDPAKIIKAIIVAMIKGGIATFKSLLLS